MRGMLARELELSDGNDEQLVDLMATGLPDEDIASLMDWTVQRVRNRIERLLDDNALMYRTQLAVIRAASLKVPDFS
jgi:DNA-binding NarL/FixJ family response regulator